jgi:hypothetical protein
MEKSIICRVHCNIFEIVIYWLRNVGVAEMRLRVKNNLLTI